VGMGPRQGLAHVALAATRHDVGGALAEVGHSRTVARSRRARAVGAAGRQSRDETSGRHALTEVCLIAVYRPIRGEGNRGTRLRGDMRIAMR